MRAYPENFLVSVDTSKQQQLIADFHSLQLYHHSFTAKSAELLNALSTDVADSQQTKILFEQERIQSLLDAIKNYMGAIKSSNLLCVTKNKMSGKDISVLAAQVSNLKALFGLLNISSTRNREEPMANSAAVVMTQGELSTFFENTARLQYPISSATAWMRRAMSFMIFLMVTACVAVISCVLTALLMTPGIDYNDPFYLFTNVMRAMLAFWHLQDRVYMNYDANIPSFGLDVTVPVPVPSFIAVPVLSIASGLLAAFKLMNTLRITNPSREEAARNLQAAMVNFLIDVLKNKIDTLSVTTQIKNYLSMALAQADKLYNDGVGSCFYKSQSSKMQKALEILLETAKIVESPVIELSENYKKLVDTQFNSQSLWKKRGVAASSGATSTALNASDRAPLLAGH